MQKIYRIAKLELSVLFYSPIAWLLLIIFIIQCGLTFTDLLYARETTQQLGGDLRNLTKVLFAGQYGLLTDVQQKLYLYIPLLTMGLMSRETSSGSIKLLFSSPVNMRQIILGKFLAMMGYCFLLVLVLSGFLVAGCYSIEALDIKFVLGGILGLYLLACAYSAIGLYMSCLTSYQVVAAISTLAVLAALNFVGQLGQGIDLVRDITYWISMAGRCDNFINGLISSKDIIYFLLVIVLFLMLCFMKLDSGRKMSSWFAKTMRYSVLIATVIVIGYVSSLPPLTSYYDTTRFRDRTLTTASQEIVAQLKSPLKITSYVNLNDYRAVYGAPKHRIKDIQQFEQFQRFLPDMKLSYISYYDTVYYDWGNKNKPIDSLAMRSATALGFDFDKLLRPSQIRSMIDLAPEENRFVRVVEYNGKRTFLRMFDDMFVYPSEAEISAAIKRLLVTPPVVGIANGHEERSTAKSGDKSYKGVTIALTGRGSLINQGFDVVDISLKERISPDQLAVLVIADPKVDYTAEELANIEAYLEQGGNLLLAAEPDRSSVINKIAARFAVSFMPGTLLQQSADFEPDLLQTKFTRSAEQYGFKFNPKVLITMSGTVGLQYDSLNIASKGYTVNPLLLTDIRSTWNRTRPFNLKTESIQFDTLQERKMAAPVMIALTRPGTKKEQKIIIAGDADFMSNAEIDRFNINNVNGALVTRMFKWFCDGAFPVKVSRPDSIDTKINVNRNSISLQKILFLGFLPGVIAIAGAVLLLRRKRQ